MNPLWLALIAMTLVASVKAPGVQLVGLLRVMEVRSRYWSA